MFYKYRNKALSGSYTVEAAFIVPIILGIIFAMMYMFFYLHDKVILYSNINKSIISAAHEADLSVSDGEWQGYMQEKLWLLDIKGGSISESGIYITANVLAVSEIYFPIINKYIDLNKKISYEVKYLKLRPETFVRTRELLNIENDTG